MRPELLTAERIAEGLAKAFGWPLYDAQREVERYRLSVYVDALRDSATMAARAAAQAEAIRDA